ncbi:hypothetical protein AAC387_Pa06g0694 [Persea americana]
MSVGTVGLGKACCSDITVPTLASNFLNCLPKAINNVKQDWELFRPSEDKQLCFSTSRLSKSSAPEPGASGF